MSTIIPFSFESKQIRVLTTEVGEPLFVAKDVAKTLGYANQADAIRTHCRHGKYLKETAIAVSYQQNHGLAYGLHGESILVPESDVYRLTMRSTLASAERFQDWGCEEVLPSIRKTGGYGASPTNSYQPDLELQVAEVAARMLRMSDTSKIRMLAGICEQKGISSALLPAYVDEGLTKAIGPLLKEHGCSLTARAANLILIDMGMLEERERIGSKGVIKRFKSLTEKGVRYGRNETSPQNPRETQPLYFVNRFPELLGLIETHLANNKAA